MAERLKYCQKKMSNVSHCSNIATYKVIIETPHNERNEYRCAEHCNSKTVKGKVIKKTIIDQSSLLSTINDELRTYIGKELYSSHCKQIVTGKYLKNNGSIMCLSKYNKWRLVYHHQIRGLYL